MVTATNLGVQSVGLEVVVVSYPSWSQAQSSWLRYQCQVAKGFALLNKAWYTSRACHLAQIGQRFSSMARTDGVRPQRTKAAIGLVVFS